MIFKLKYVKEFSKNAGLFLFVLFLGVAKTNAQTQISKENLKPLPKTIFDTLWNQCNGIECTFYNSSKSIALQAQHTKYILGMFVIKAPEKELKVKKQAYIMFIVNDDFYIEAELVMQDLENYLVFKKNDQEYYALLNEKGVDFFKKYIK